MSAMRGFDGVNKLKRAARRIDAELAGKDTKAPETSASDAAGGRGEKPTYAVRHFTVLKKFRGKEAPVAFWVTEPEGEAFMAVARRQMAKTSHPNEDGEPYFEASTFRLVEDL